MVLRRELILKMPSLTETRIEGDIRSVLVLAMVVDKRGRVIQGWHWGMRQLGN